MIININVLSLFKATQIINGIKSTNHNAWITTVDIGDKQDIDILYRRNQSRKIPHCVRYFKDIYEESTLFKYTEHGGPSQEDIDVIVSFIKTLVNSKNSYNLGINCYAGISRSSAVSLIARVLNGEDSDRAISNAYKDNFQMWPNMRILRLAEKYTGKELTKEVEKWKKQHENDLALPPTF